MMEIILFFTVFILFMIGFLFLLLKERVLFIMGVRNILLRRGYAAIIIMGLMIGTAVITSSLVVGDTMNTMVESEVLDTFYLTDEKIISVKPTGEREYFNASLFSQIQQDFNQPFIDGLSPSIKDRVAILNLATNLSNPSVSLYGIDFLNGDNFGSFYTTGNQLLTSLQADEVMMGEATAQDLDAQLDDRIIIYAQNNFHFFTITYILSPRERAASGEGLYVNLETAQDILNKSGLINEILISNKGGVKEGLSYTDDVKTAFSMLSLPNGLDFQLGDIKKEILDDNIEDMRVFTDLFFVFGSFSIIAGIILIINIFVMLAEERKSEMGMARAIGMKRKHLKRMYLSEGSIYAVFSSLIGVFLGVGIGFVIMAAMSQIFSTFGAVNILQYFTVTPFSMIMGFIAGFLITLVTIYVTAHRISNLNIVRAIRSIPEPKIQRGDKRITLLGFLVIFLGISLLAVGIISFQAAPYFIGLSLLILSIGFLGRRFIGDRWAFNLTAILLFLLWFLPSSVFPDYTGGIEMFIISGLFLVFAALLLVMFNSTQLTHGLTIIFGKGKAFQAVLKTAISYSLRSKFRTGMTIAIFALIIFSITTMSMIVGILGTNIESQIRKSAGGYDILAFSLINSPITDLQGELANNDLDHRIDKAVGLLSGQVKFNISSTPEETYTYTLLGVTNTFINQNEFEFDKIHEDYQDPQEVWDALRQNSSVIIIDASVQGTEFGPPSQFITDVGEKIYIRDKNNNTLEKTIIGILDTVLVQGIISHATFVEKEFDLTDPTFFLFKAKENENIENLSKAIESSFLLYGMQVLDLESLIIDFLRVMNQFFNLFESYMALGLIIGIAGLGIITIRSVHERRQQIGMMRALGFKRKMVLQSFLIETAFVAILGISIGTILGISIGYLLWRDEFAPQGFEFMINWQPILLVALIAFIVTLISIIPASRKASLVPPAEALRYKG